MFKILAEEEDRGVEGNPLIMTLVNEMANRLFTVCSIFRENPYI